MNKELLDKFKTRTGSLQSTGTGKGSLGVTQRNCPNRQGDEIIVVVVSIMRERKRERSKTQEKQMMHSTVAQHPPTDAQPVPFTGKCSRHTAQVAEGESREMVRKAKALTEVNLAKNIKGNKNLL